MNTVKSRNSGQTTVTDPNEFVIRKHGKGGTCFMLRNGKGQKVVQARMGMGHNGNY